jgi:hypothetical protein
MISKITLAACTAALLALSTAAVAADAKPSSAKPKPKNECFFTQTIDGFAAPDEHTVYVRAGVRDVYKFQLMGICPDIDWSQRIALVSRSGSSICTGMDAEIVTHTQIGPQRCPVRSMHKLTPEEIAALPPKARP